MVAVAFGFGGVACSGGGTDGFELDAHVTATGASLTRDGAPISWFDVDYDFASIDAAMQAPITLEVDDGEGAHDFDLSSFVSECTLPTMKLGTVETELVDLAVSYTPCEFSGQVDAGLSLCFQSVTCTGTDGTSTLTP